MPLGWQLRQLMADRKMTNDELAKFISNSTGKKKHSVTISRWRQEDIMPKLDGKELGAIIEALECRLSDLIPFISNDDAA